MNTTIYNSLNLIGLGIIWLTQAENDSISADLLAGKTFIKIDRLQKTFNVSQIISCGPTSCMSDPLVAGGEFKFSRTGIWAKNNGIEYVWNKGWMSGRGTWDTCGGMSFDDFIASTTLS